VLAFAITAIAGGVAGAPILDAGVLRASSRTGKATLVLDPYVRKMQVFIEDGAATRRKWWERSSDESIGFISDDGEYAAIGQTGNNLVDDRSPDRTMISFYHRGALVRAVTLAEVVFEPARLDGFPPEIAWGQYVGFIGPRRFAVDTEEKRRIVFDVTTGLAVGPAPRRERGTQLPAKTARPIRLTTTGQRHGGIPAVARGPSELAVAWEEQDPAGTPGSHIALAILDQAGQIRRAPRIVLDTGRSVPDLHLVWNGEAFTFIACGTGWPAAGQATVLWGVVDVEGGFREAGRHGVFGHNDAFGCGTPAVGPGGVFVPVKIRDSAYDKEGPRHKRRCTIRPLAVTGSSATIGSELPLCHVIARTPEGIVGVDSDGQFVAIDPRGRTRPAPVMNDLVGSANHKASISLPSLSGGRPTALRALDGDLIAAYRQTPDGIDVAFFQSNGAVRWQGQVTLPGEPGAHPRSLDCAGASDALACVYVAGDTLLREDVYSVLLRP
jgi:hypothetical protein